VKTIAVILSLTISTIAVSLAFAPASASKMDGKTSSDGGRSAAAKKAMKRNH
jgi:hypothetical protein